VKLADGRIVHPYASTWLGYGLAGTKKSDFFSTFPKPMLVHMFDPWGKERPYLRRGRPHPNHKTYDAARFQDDHGTWVTEVYHRKDDRLLIRIEHYVDDASDIYKPDAYDRYHTRTKEREKEDGFDEFKTVGWDSLTYFAMARRKWDEFVLNATSKSGKKQDGKQWYGAAARAVEDEICRRATMLRMNTFVTAHINMEKKDAAGATLFLPAAPGQLATALPAGFAEVYRFYMRGGEYQVQTQPNSQYVACTQIPAPNGFDPDGGYRGIWDELED